MSLLEILRVPETHVLEENYTVLMETHVQYLREHPKTTLQAVEGLQAEKYTGDLDGLLDFMAVDKKYHYLITRMNGYNCSNDYEGEKLEFLIPAVDVASQFLEMYTSIED